MSGDIDAICALDAHGQADLVRRGDVPPTALLDAALARIDALNPALNAVAHVAAAQAHAALAGLDRSAPMAGVPYLLKASMEYPGFPWLSGSRSRQGTVGRRKYPFARRMDALGLVPCGLSTMPEFGLIGSGEALLYGPTRNPWNLEHGAGGSSSGAAAAVAACMVPLATGSDGGGSIRIPASHCGIIGFKPSRNWNLRARAVSLIDDLLASDGLYGRSMRDTAWAARALRSQPPGPAAPGRPLRIAVSLQGLDGQLPAPDIVEMIGRTATLCADLGHAVEPRELPLDLGALNRAFDILWSYGAGEVVDLTRSRLGAAADAVLEPWTLGLADRRQAVTPDDLAAALSAIGRIDLHLATFWERFDLVLSPVAASTAPSLGVLAPDRAFDELWRDHFRHVNHTQLQNMAGYPGLSLPLFEGEGGLPAGAMFWTRHGGDDLLLALGAALEEARPWAHRRPPLA
ncbi:amidase family protein [Niveispirillum fermenti]|uniref:amidase family protein n=1 Tax=Niveispirillum fermenti TaxID=1233113 RepID=UPI003A8514FE